MIINHNIPAMFAYNSLSNTNNALAKAINKLSTGLRINSAADDAAGLAISEKMRAQIRGLDQAVRNSQDGISMIQTAEGALGETHSILQRMRELSVQAANDTLTQQDRSYIQLEVDQLKEEIDRIANTTQFNKKKLLDGSAAALWSSDSLDTRAIINGGLRQIDQFGQKNSAEGNYKISIIATPGKAEVQKSDIFKIKHSNVIMNVSKNTQKGVVDVSVDNLPAGHYSVGVVAGSVAKFNLQQNFGIGTAGTINNVVDVSTATTPTNTAGVTLAGASVYFEVLAQQGDKVTFRAVSNLLYADGTVETKTNENLIVQQGMNANLSALGLGNNTFSFTNAADFNVGGKMVVGYAANTIVYSSTTVNTIVSANQINSAVLVAASAYICGIVAYCGSFLINTAGGTIKYQTSLLDFMGVLSSDLSFDTAGAGTKVRVQSAGGNNVYYTLASGGAVGLGVMFLDSSNNLIRTISSVRRLDDIAGLYTAMLDGAASVVSAGAMAIGSAAMTSALSTVAASASVNGMEGFLTRSAAEIKTLSAEFQGVVYMSAGATPGYTTITAITFANDTCGTDTSNTLAADFGFLQVISAIIAGSGVMYAQGYVTRSGASIDKLYLVSADVALGLLFATDSAGTNLISRNLDGLYKAAAWTAAFDDQISAIVRTGPFAGKFTTIVSAYANSKVAISGTVNPDWDGAWSGSGVTGDLKDREFALAATSVQSKDIHFRNFYLNETNGTLYESDIVIKTDDTFIISGAFNMTTFDAAYVGQVAKGDVKLRDLDKFWDANGRFMLDDPQVLTLSQGDGKKTQITLNSTDTLRDVAKKLNNAIAFGLGQAKYVDTNGATKNFATFVDGEINNTSSAVDGTIVLRSVVAGTNGKFSFSGDEDIIKALSLNTIQQATESQFRVSIADAHKGTNVASNVNVVGNMLYGVVNKNVDVQFDAMANTSVVWSDATQSFTLVKEKGTFETTLHLADNTTVYQIGANEKEDMGVNIGDMGTRSLGITSILLTDRDSASRSITVIDSAIDKVSKQRAMLGAYQNRLEHTISNLSVAGTNLTAAESRIRDLDMAKEMVNFTKLQILAQAGTSMLAQANQLPQNVLSLLR